MPPSSHDAGTSDERDDWRTASPGIRLPGNFVVEAGRVFPYGFGLPIFLCPNGAAQIMLIGPARHSREDVLLRGDENVRVRPDLFAGGDSSSRQGEGVHR